MHSEVRKRIDVSTAAATVLACVILGLAVALIICYIHGYVWNQPYPYNSFLPQGISTYGDFYSIQSAWVTYHLAPPASAGVGLVYPPAVDLLLQIVSFPFPGPYAGHWATLVLFLGTSTGAIIVMLRRMSPAVVVMAVITFYVSLPVMFAVATANIEGLIGAILLCVIVARKYGHFTIAAVLLGTAIAMKILPIVFLPALLAYRTWREIRRTALITVGTALGINVFAVLVLPGGGFGAFFRVIDRMREAQTSYDNEFVDGEAGTHFGNSFLNGVHAFFGEHVMRASYDPDLVLVVGGIILAAAFVYGLRRGARLWMLYAFCACGACLIVPVSGNYRLLYFIPPIIALLAEPVIDRRWMPILVVLSFIIIPKPWGLRHGTDPFADASVYVPPLLMILLIAWIVLHLAQAGQAPGIVDEGPEVNPGEILDVGSAGSSRVPAL